MSSFIPCVYWGISACLIAAVASVAPLPAWGDGFIGTIKTKKGEVSAQHAGQIVPLSVGDHVFQSDIISTGKGSSVGMTFTDSSMMTLGPSSKLTLDQFCFDTTTFQGVFNSSLSKGTLAVKSGDIVRQTPEAMHIAIPAALLGVRGTEFAVRADGGK